MTVATTGQAMQQGLGWRKALRTAIADNLFVKGEGCCHAPDASFWGIARSPSHCDGVTYPSRKLDPMRVLM